VFNNGVPLTESMAICEFLDEACQDPKLIPRDIIEKAQVRAFCETVNAGIQPLQNMKVLGMVKDCGGKPNDWARFWIDKGLGGKI
jgi:glutathione S-transferase